MKKILLLIFIGFIHLISNAQAPKFFNYQAVIRDNNGNLLINQPMDVEVKISNSSSIQDQLYIENHNSVSTNANGLLILKIGTIPTPALGIFDSIKWDNGNYHIFFNISYTIGIDNYNIQFSDRLASVPFALFAANGGGSGTPGPAGPAGIDGKTVLSGLINPDVSIGTQGDFYINTNTFNIFGPKTIAGWGNPTNLVGPQGTQGQQGTGIPIPGNAIGNMLYWNGSQWVIIPAGSNGQNLTFCNGIPQWGPCNNNVPVLTTDAASSITTNSAYVGGVITSDGGTNVTERGICYSTTQNPGLSDNKTIIGLGIGPFSSQIINLTPNTTYYVKAYAINANGTAFGNQQSFTTTSANLPTLNTYAISNITSNSASGGGEITNNGGSSILSRGICWHTNSNPTISNNSSLDGVGNGSFTSNLTGLLPGTIYYVRAYATNASGISYGDQKSFITTTSSLPTLTTTAASNISYESAVSGGNITSDGGSLVTNRGVCWSSTNQNPTISDSQISSGTGIGSYISYLNGLNHNTTYYLRAFATNGQGTAYGNSISFTTNTILNPTLTTSATTNISFTTAISGGSISSDGGGAVLERGVCYSTNANPIYTDLRTSDGIGIGNFTSSITNLISGTTYYVRAYAKNNAGVGYGNLQTFTTTAILLPAITTSNITGITSNSAVSGGNISANGGGSITARGVCWNTTGNPTITNNFTTDGTGIGSFTSNITNLNQGTTYYARAYATNSAGTSYGSQQVFITTAISLATVNTANISNTTSNSAVCGGNVASDGGGIVIQRGVCWSTSSMPTTQDQRTIDGNGLGSFSSFITGLNHNTTYYVRAYAINEAGPSYGNQLNFTTNPLINPVITTSLVSSILVNTAVCGGTISSDGGATITARGVCWSTTPNPTITANFTENGSGIGNFTSNITGLSPATTYYVRAYATNILGTHYGSQQIFTTIQASVPVLTTSSVSSLGTVSVISGGNITSDGGSAILTRGICWNTQTNPSISNFKTSNGIGSGIFVSQITGLSPNTTYYARAYASNSSGVSYGNEISFTTLQNGSNVSTVTDIDGNIYDTVAIGSQVWLKQNLNTTKFNNGNPISLITDVTQWSIVDSAAYSNFNNSISNPTNYGRLYNYFVVSDTRNICPIGWHIPSQAEWNTLITYLGGSSIAGGKLKEIGITNWLTPNTGATNSSNFTALPANKRGSDGIFTISGESAFFWTSTLSTTTRGFYKNIDYNQEGINEGNHSFRNGLSIRCIKNVASNPTLSTTSIINIGPNSAVSGGNIVSDGGSAIIAKGVCWSTASNPSISNSTTNEGSGNNFFISTITGLIPNTIYYVRAYATNSAGTAYGNIISFTTLQNSVFAISDIDGNLYDTITIGTQVWMKSNLKTTKYRNGNPINESNDPWQSLITGGCADYNDDSTKTLIYGKLYNYNTVIDGRKICPIGWKVPNNNDLIILRDYLGGTNIAGGKLKETGNLRWVSPNTDASNQSGFSAYAGGFKTDLGTYSGLGMEGNWWTINTSSATQAILLQLSYNSGNFIIANKTFNNGLSVRCIKE